MNACVAAPPQLLTFWCDGVPAPQGSKKGFVVKGRAVIVDDNPATLKAWRQAVDQAALQQIDQNRRRGQEWETLQGPVQVNLVFWLPRPRSHYRTGKFSHLLRADAPARPGTKPDLDKLTRAIGDSLTTARVYGDDSLVVQSAQAKHFAERPEQCGVHVTVQLLEEN